MEPVIRNEHGNSNPLLGPEDGVSSYVMLYVKHGPGESSPDHVHEWEHQAFITRGEGIIWVDGTEYPIKAGDCVMVPPGSLHHFKNTGDSVLSRVTFNSLSSTEGSLMAHGLTG